MPTTEKRECGYVQLHKLYLTIEPGGLVHHCDRLPIALEPCPTCGCVPHFSRGITKIDPYQLWGIHESCNCGNNCPLCNPKPADEVTSFLMWVGEKFYTVESFCNEGDKLGVSKAIPFIPKDFVLGNSWVYFARRNYVDKVEGSHPDPKKVKKVDGIFSGYRPTKINYVITETEAEDEELMKNLQEKGITAVVVPDDDEAHVPKSARYKIKKKYADKNKKKLDTFIELHCPNCQDTYKPTYPSKVEAFKTEDNEAREQWITGLCSTICWKQFLSIDGEKPKNLDILKDAMKNAE